MMDNNTHRPWPKNPIRYFLKKKPSAPRSDLPPNKYNKNGDLIIAESQRKVEAANAEFLR
jgi:hypothetical protein